MYHFQVSGHTQTGEFIGIVGSSPALGAWDISKCVRLVTNRDRYPQWFTEKPIEISAVGEFDQLQRVEYKYVRLNAKGNVEYESWGNNRWIPIGLNESNDTIVVDDGAFGYIQPHPFGYLARPNKQTIGLNDSTGLKIIVIGSSVALGQKAWMMQGWAGQLAETLQQKYGHQVVNLAEAGANVSRTIARFGSVVTPEQPDVVIIALSLGNEGFAHCPPQERRAVQRRFESGLQQLIKMTRALGALPILGGVYPHGDYTSAHHTLLKDTQRRMLTWGIPILDWLAVVDNGQGGWRAQTSFDPAHPNTYGHQLMFEAIDLSIFDLDPKQLSQEKHRFWQIDEVPIYLDNAGFYLCACPTEKRLRISNPSPYKYTIAAYWQELQAVLKTKAGLIPGIYIAENHQHDNLEFFAVQADGTISTMVEIPPETEVTYSSAFHLFAPNNSQVLFYDGQLGLLKKDETHVWAINESDHEYNIQPMWPEVRSALKAMPEGVYANPKDANLPFGTMLIGQHGLESRVKVPPQSAMLFQYQCKLSEINRVGIIPLGDRCAVRMMLYKMGFDGPAYPFDLTRTSSIADVADIIDNRFFDMWNPSLAYYHPETRRIQHRKWVNLSYGHEIEDYENPLENMSPIYERMRTRYSARAERFWHTIQHSDRLLFVRTGGADRGGVMDLLDKLKKHCQGKPFHLLILSPQDSQEFTDLPHVLHYNVEFNPDRMYADLGHWLYCTEIFRGILESLRVSSNNLFWCPPNPAQETHRQS